MTPELPLKPQNIPKYSQRTKALFQSLLAPFLKGSKNRWERYFFEKKKYL